MSSTPAPSPVPHIHVETAADAAAVEALVARAFGPGRLAKAAERLREGNAPRRELSVTAWSGERLVGVVRLWPITVGGASALLLGPIAVDAAARGQGLAQAMARRACELAAAAGEGLVMLVGEARLFEPLGFRRVEAGQVRLPGPVDPQRIFVRELAPGAFDGVSGAVRLP